jgi:hypothetical protein
MNEVIGVDETSGSGAVPKKGDRPMAKGMPPWLRSALMMLAGALIIGGIWFAYESGRSAGNSGSVAGGNPASAHETSATEVAESGESAVATEQIGATAASGDQAASGGTSGSGSSGTSSGGSSGSSSGGSSSSSSSGGGSSGSSSGGSAVTPSKNTNTLKPSASSGITLTAPKVPHLLGPWKTVHENSGNTFVSSPTLHLAKGYVRITCTTQPAPIWYTMYNYTSCNFWLDHPTSPHDTFWSWAAPVENHQVYNNSITSPPVAIAAGDYRMNAMTNAVLWTVKVEWHK